MTKKIGIFYFSGTGNTEIVADLINKEFKKHDYIIESRKIEDILNNNININIDEYDLIGIGSPVIAFGTSRIVNDFIKKMPFGNSKKIFLFKTAGGIAPGNYNSSISIIKKLKKKGYEVIYERMFSIGSNWIIKFPDEITKELYKAAIHKVGLMCNEIINGKKRLLKAPVSVKIITGSIHFFEKLSVRFISKDYKVTKACNLCGICRNKCPVKNIYQKKNKIKFGISCLWCMRCVYACPKNAISHRLLSFCVVKGGYNPKSILNNPVTNNDKEGGFIPKFFAEYVKNNDM
jgi:flavodoxin/NAD-dependent dihydropyrimidine dehydrogenase PreA subunit